MTGVAAAAGAGRTSKPPGIRDLAPLDFSLAEKRCLLRVLETLTDHR